MEIDTTERAFIDAVAYAIATRESDHLHSTTQSLSDFTAQGKDEYRRKARIAIAAYTDAVALMTARDEAERLASEQKVIAAAQEQLPRFFPAGTTLEVERTDDPDSCGYVTTYASFRTPDEVEDEYGMLIAFYDGWWTQASMSFDKHGRSVVFMVGD